MCFTTLKSWEMKIRESGQVALQVPKQVDDLGLHADIERRDGFVADQELGLNDECSGNADALALAAGKLVRVAVDVFGKQAHPLEQSLHPRRDFALRQVWFMGHERFGDDLASRHPGIQRTQGILEDHLHVAAQEPAFCGIQRQKIPALPQRPAPGGGYCPDQGAGKGGLAGSALADNTERLARGEIETDAPDGSKFLRRDPGGMSPGTHAKGD